HARVQLPARILVFLSFLVSIAQKRVQPAAKRGHVVDDGGDVCRVPVEEAIAQDVGRKRTVPFNDGPAEEGKDDRYEASAHRVVARGLAHHLSLRRRPIPLVRQPPESTPLPERRQLPIFRAGVPNGGAIGQQKLAATAARLLLLAGEPIADGWDQIIV